MMEELELDPSALSSLTSKINAKLNAKGSDASLKSPRPGRSDGKRPKLNKAVKASGSFAGADQPRSKNAGARPSASEGNKKRLRDGQIKTAPSDRKVSGQRNRVVKSSESHITATSKDSKAATSDRTNTRTSSDRPRRAKAKSEAVPQSTYESLAAARKDERNQNGFVGRHAERLPSKGDVEASLPKKEQLRPKNESSAVLIEPMPEWYTHALPDIAKDFPETNQSTMLISLMHERGKTLLSAENEAFAARSRSGSSSHQFYTTIISSGTLTDKVSALTLLVQESPIHNMRALEALIGLAGKRSRAQAIEVLTALKDLFAQGSLLPPTRHLKAFNAQDSLYHLDPKGTSNYDPSTRAPSPLTDAHLVFWTFEDWLKGKYFEVLQILETWAGDEIQYSRSKAVDMVYELLRERPEQEANLLRLLVNKLGDVEKKIASRASYNLLQLQTPHPLMRPNIISAIESDIIFRSGQSHHAKYYAVTTLNQTILSSNNDAVTRKLLDIYFSLFASLLAEQATSSGESDIHKNRKGEMQGGGGRPGKMAKKKNAAAVRKGTTVDESMREKIISAVLTGINRAIPYTETNNEFFEKHLDTLFRITHSSNFNTSIQAMLLIQQVCGSHPAALDRFYRTLYESLLDPRLLNSSKQAMYLNLLYRALKADLNVKRVQAFAKRLLQVISMHQPAFVCGVVYLLRELEAIFPSLSSFIDQPEEDPTEDDIPTAYNVGVAGSHSLNKSAVYDGKKRDPEYSHADRSCPWELDPLLQHFHPSVTLFATSLVKHEGMPSKPTLESHTLIQFLDRFVYRNPKKNPNKWHGPSIMQPLAAADSSGQLLSPNRKGSGQPLANSAAFANLSIDQVRADEMFFHKYFSKTGSKQDKIKKKKKSEKANNDSEDDGEDEIWQALLNSQPELEGGDGDSDLDLDDFSDDADLQTAMEDLGDSDLDSEEDGPVLEGMTEPSPPFEDEEEDIGKESATSRRKAASKRRKELRDLPTFASVEDYEAMMNNVEGEEG